MRLPVTLLSRSLEHPVADKSDGILLDNADGRENHWRFAVLINRLALSKCHDWIDPHRTHRGNITRCETHAQEQSADRNKGDRNRRAYAIEEADRGQTVLDMEDESRDQQRQ